MATLLHALLRWVLYAWLVVAQACARTMEVLRHWSWQRHAVPLVEGLAIPRHLAVVFVWPARAQDSHVRAAQADIPRLAQWSALSGIAELTVYDTDGVLARLYAGRTTASTRDAWAAMEVHLGRGISSSTSFSLPLPPPRRYEAPPRQPRVRVNLISAADDKPALVAAFQATDTWEPHALSHTLYHAGVMTSEPDILMVCGDTAPAPRLHGFPAWTLRLTTLGSLPSWAYVRRWTPVHFLDTLRLYTATEQRHGA